MHRKIAITPMEGTSSFKKKIFQLCATHSPGVVQREHHRKRCLVVRSGSNWKGQLREPYQQVLYGHRFQWPNRFTPRSFLQFNGKSEYPCQPLRAFEAWSLSNVGAFS